MATIILNGHENQGILITSQMIGPSLRAEVHALIEEGCNDCKLNGKCKPSPGEKGGRIIVSGEYAGSSLCPLSERKLVLANC